MKQLTLILLLFLGQTAFSQLQIEETTEPEMVGEWRFGNKQQGAIYKMFDPSEAYALRFRNLEYTTIDDYFIILLEPKESTLNELYDLCIKMLEEGKEESVQIGEYGTDDTFTVRQFKLFGNWLVFTKNGKSSQHFNAKRLAKLFDK